VNERFISYFGRLFSLLSVMTFSRVIIWYHHNSIQFYDFIFCTVSGWTVCNPLTPTVAIQVQLWSILCQTGLCCHVFAYSALSVKVPGCQKLQTTA